MASSDKTVSPSTFKDLLRGLSLNIVSNLFLYFGQLIIARQLPREDYATFTVVVSFVSLMALFADLGLTALFARKFAEAEALAKIGKKDMRGELLGSMLGLRFFMALVVSVLVMTISPIMGYPIATQHLMMIMLITLFISSRLLVFRSVGEAFLRGHNKYHFVALFMTVDAVVFASALFFYSGKILDLEAAVWIYSICHLPGFLLLAGMIYRNARSIGFKLSFRLAAIGTMMREGMPLVLSAIFLTIHNYADPLLLNRLSTPAQVSAFGASMRVLSAIIFLPLVFGSIISPLVTQAVVKNDFQRMRSVLDRAFRLLVIIAILVALSISSAPTSIIHLLFGGDKYIDATPIIILFGWMFIPLCFGTFLSDIAFAEGKYWLPTLYTGIIMVISISLNFLLIPLYGALGTGIAKCAALTVGSLVLLSFSKSLNVINRNAFLRFIGKIILTVLVAEVSGYFLSSLGFNEFVIAGLVCTIFLILVVLSKAILIEEISSFINNVLRRKKTLPSTES